MVCLRCDGLMRREVFIDFAGSDGSFEGWRCLVCGEIVDPEIYRHRLMQSSLRDRQAEVFSRKTATKSRNLVRLSA